MDAQELALQLGVSQDDLENAFGLMLTVEAYGVNQNAKDVSFINNFMNTLPPAIGMKVLDPARTFHYDGGDLPADSGITSLVLLAESHASFHAFDKQDFLTFDLYSCKLFNPIAVLGALEQSFGIQQRDANIIIRGRDYNRRQRYRVVIEEIQQGEQGLVLKPLEDRIVIEALEAEEKTAGGLVLPNSVKDKACERGKVLAIGPGRLSTTGDLIPMDIKVGDVVLIEKHTGTEVTIQGKKYKIVFEKNTLGVFEGE